MDTANAAVMDMPAANAQADVAVANYIVQHVADLEASLLREKEQASLAREKHRAVVEAALKSAKEFKQIEAQHREALSSLVQLRAEREQQARPHPASSLD